MGIQPLTMTNATRPATAPDGTIRHNTDTGRMETFNGFAWVNMIANPETFFTGAVRLISDEIDDYFTVEVIGGIFSSRNLRIQETTQWCVKQFGHGGFMMNRDAGTVIENGQRWYFGDNKFWFKSERDRTLFLLRWAGE